MEISNTFDNDWYDFIEYGTTNPDTIFLQQNGFSREASIFILDPKNAKIIFYPWKMVRERLNEAYFNAEILA